MTHLPFGAWRRPSPLLRGGALATALLVAGLAAAPSALAQRGQRPERPPAQATT